MDRRKALKNMSLAIGSFAITPSIVSILTSCSSNKVEDHYLLLSKEQSSVIDYLVAIILPISDANINYTAFIDKMMFYTVAKEGQQLFKRGYLEFENNYQSLFKEKISKTNKRKVQKMIEKYFSIPKQKEEAIFTLLEKDFSLVAETQKSEYLNYYFLTKVRYYCLLGFCTSEYYKKPV